MRLLLFTIVILGAALLLEGAPTDEACKKEIMRAKECGKSLPRKLRVYTPKEFQQIQKAADSFYKCLGTPECDITKSTLAVGKEEMKMAEKMSELYHCLGNNHYEESKNACNGSYIRGDCSKKALDAYVGCIATRLSAKLECTSEDLEKFKKVSEPKTMICQLKENHKEKFEGFRHEM